MNEGWMEMYEGEVEMERDHESARRRRKKTTKNVEVGWFWMKPTKKRRDGEKGR